MSYQIALTDDEYHGLAAAAAERGQPIEALVHEALAERYSMPIPGVKHSLDPLIT
jgi:hypothetical protein